MKLTTTLEPRGAVAALLLTDAQVADLGHGQKEFPVRVTVNGARLSLRVLRLRGENLICLAKADRQQANLEIGVAAEVEIELDTGEQEQATEITPSASASEP